MVSKYLKTTNLGRQKPNFGHENSKLDLSSVSEVDERTLGMEVQS